MTPSTYTLFSDLFHVQSLTRLVGYRRKGWRGSPWVYLGGYVVLRFLQSSGGLGALRDVSSYLFILGAGVLTY